MDTVGEGDVLAGVLAVEAQLVGILDSRGSRMAPLGRTRSA
jgi:hypothetical protein